MLLTIHNLPATIRYSDIKDLIKSKCGSMQVILDNLVIHNKLKSVTVGLADEADAAILVRKMNGLYMDGAQLYVEDTRQSKQQDQPYRPSDAALHQSDQQSGQMTFQSNNNMLSSQSNMTYRSMNDNIMMYTIPYGMYTPTLPAVQNAGFMNYGQPMVQNIADMQTPMQGQGFINNYMSSNTFQGASREEPNSNSYQPTAKKPRWDVEQKTSSSRSEIPERNSRRSSSDNRKKDDIRRASYNSGSKFGSRGRQESHDKSRSNRDSRTQDNRREISQPAIPSLFDVPSYKDIYDEQFFIGSSSQSKAQHNTELQNQQQSSAYYNHPSLRSEPQFAGRADLKQVRKLPNMTEPAYKDKGRSGEAYSNRSNNEFSDSYSRRYSADRNNFDEPNIKPQKSLDDWPNDIRRRYFSPPDNDVKDDNRKRKYNDALEKLTGSAYHPSHWAHESNNYGYDDRRSKVSDFHESREVRHNRVRSEDRGPRYSDRRVLRSSEYSRESRDRKLPQNSEQKLRDDRREREKLGKQPPSNGKDKVSRSVLWQQKQLAIKRATANLTWPPRPVPMRQENRPPKAAPVDSKTALINKDQTCRGQATSEIAKEIIANLQIQPEEAKHILKPLKLSIRSRVDLLVGGEMQTSKEDVIIKYRKRFPKKGDVAFFDAVLKEYEKECKLAEKTEDKEGVVRSTAPRQESQKKRVEARLGVKTEPVTPKKPIAGGTNTDKIPKYPNADKKNMKLQKQQCKQEILDENTYELPEPMKTLLNEEMEELCKPFSAYEDSEEPEMRIVNKILKKSLPDIKTILRNIVVKRILNITSNLLVRIFFYGKVPQGEELDAFLKNHGVISCRKTKSGKFFIANIDTYENYDKILAVKLTNIGGVSLTIRPLLLPKVATKACREQAKNQKKAIVKPQIDTTEEKSRVIEDEHDLSFSGNMDELEDY